MKSLPICLIYLLNRAIRVFLECYSYSTPTKFKKDVLITILPIKQMANYFFEALWFLVTNINAESGQNTSGFNLLQIKPLVPDPNIHLGWIHK